MYESALHSASPKNIWKLALLIIILGAFFRLWGAFELNEYIEDEVLHVSDSMSLGTYGTTAAWGWHHPQLSELIMYGSIQIFGNNPVGWRSSNIFFGTISVLLIFLIGRLLFPNSTASLIAAALLAFDPHHIYLSRTTFVEIPVICFFLLYLYLMLEYTENKRATLPLAGIAMGLTIATKAYFVFAIPLVVLYSIFRLHQRRELSITTMVDMTLCLLCLPCAIYLFSYIQWFSRGYTLPEFFQMKFDAVWGLKKLGSANFVNLAFLEAGGKPWEWFTKPLFWGHQRLVNNEEGRFLLLSNNPPFRLLALPALFAVSVYALKYKRVQEGLAPLLFISCCLLIIAAQRPMFSYSGTVLVPFAYLAIAQATTYCAEKIDRINLVTAAFISATIIWCIYMFPLLSARHINTAPFKPILSLVRYMGNF